MVDNGRDRARGNVANDRFDQRLPQSFIGEQPVRQGGDRLGAVITRALQLLGGKRIQGDRLRASVLDPKSG